MPMSLSKRADDYIYRLGVDQRTITRQLDGLQESDLFLQPQPRGNCANWVLGHIVQGRQNILRTLGLDAFWTADEEAIYARGSQPITSEASPHLTMQRLLGDLAQAEDILIVRLEQITDEEWDVLDEDGDSLAKVINFQIWHEGYHVGQFEVLRQLTGVNDHVI